MSRAVIVAHGQPSDPLPAAAALEALAGRVAALLPGWEIGAATLAEAGALARAATGRQPGLIYPLFMAAGWFTQTAIPARLEEVGATGWRVLAPFGCDPAVQGLAVDIVRAAAPEAVLLAAHGSFKSPAPAAVAEEVAAQIADAAGLHCTAAFIDQSPRIAEARGFSAGAVCLPFFAMSGGHVETDLPAALAEAGFPGPVLPALGLHPRVPGLIAAALHRAALGQ